MGLHRIAERCYFGINGKKQRKTDEDRDHFEKSIRDRNVWTFQKAEDIERGNRIHLEELNFMTDES